MNRLMFQTVVSTALMEDVGAGDWTSEGIFSDEEKSKGVFVAKAEGVLAGMPVVKEVYRQMDSEVTVTSKVSEGQQVRNGTILAEIHGSTRSVLMGERVALNFLQRLSGIASCTAKYAAIASKYDCKIVDTRKTTPGLRLLEKYAVKTGGGYNHRLNLSDAVLIKDNHIHAAGSIVKAVEMLRETIPFTTAVEVEVESLKQLEEALASGVEIVMLDNMPLSMMRQAVKIAGGRVTLEASGGITLDNVEETAACGVDLISVGELTHSVKAMDISLDLT